MTRVEWSLEVVDWVYEVGNILQSWGIGKGPISMTWRLFILVSRKGRNRGPACTNRDFDGLTPREVLAVLTLAVEALETVESALTLFVGRAVELLFPADEGPPDTFLNVEGASLAAETRDYSFEADSEGLSLRALVLWSALGEVDTFKSIEARDLKEAAEGFTRLQDPPTCDYVRFYCMFYGYLDLLKGRRIVLGNGGCVGERRMCWGKDGR